MRKPFLFACLLFAGATLAGCEPAASPPADPDAKAATPKATGHHELKEAIESVDHRDKAAAAGDAVLEADKRREQELKDAGG